MRGQAGLGCREITPAPRDRRIRASPPADIVQSGSSQELMELGMAVVDAASRFFPDTALVPVLTRALRPSAR